MTPITPAIAKLIKRLFPASDRSAVRAALQNLELGRTPEIERIHAAILKLSKRDLILLLSACCLAELDWRDVLMAADFGHDATAHLRWMAATQQTSPD
ncbi:MAG: hypothetical protein ACREJ2_13660 [Planctomycetota bacterium]